MRKKSAFALIELLVVISIILIFAGTGFSQYNVYTEQVKLKNEGKKLVDVIELAKKKALSSDLQDTNCDNFSGYKITINSDAYSLLFGCAGAYSSIQRYNLQTNILAVIGAGDLNFPPLMTNPNFSITSIRLKNITIDKCIDIAITPIGIISLDETLISC